MRGNVEGKTGFSNTGSGGNYDKVGFVKSVCGTIKVRKTRGKSQKTVMTFAGQTLKVVVGVNNNVCNVNKTCAVASLTDFINLLLSVVQKLLGFNPLGSLATNVSRNCDKPAYVIAFTDNFCIFINIFCSRHNLNKLREIELCLLIAVKNLFGPCSA